MRLGNQKKKKNNKGFSLVELIVVVLIIAIIAVALAPQVMKWVGTAKDNVDKNNMATLKSAVLIAIADYQQANSATSIVADDFVEADIHGASTGLALYIKNVLNDEYPQPANGSGYKISVSSDAKVTITRVTP